MSCHFPLDGVCFTGPVVHITKPKSTYQKRILCIGCSFTAGHGVASKLHTYPSLLSERFQDCDFWNCGISGAGTYLHLLRSPLYNSVNPDLVIFQIMDSFRNPSTFVSESQVKSFLDGDYGPFGAQETVNGWEFWKRSQPYRRSWNKEPAGRNSFHCLPQIVRSSLRASSLKEDRAYIQRLIDTMKCPFILCANSMGYPSMNDCWYESYTDYSEALNKNYKNLGGSQLVEMKLKIDPSEAAPQGYHPSRLWHAELANLLGDLI